MMPTRPAGPAQGPATFRLRRIVLFCGAALLATSGLVGAVLLDPPSSAQLRFDRPAADPRSDDAVEGAPPAFDCGDLFYDDGTAENAIFFGGGQAGEDDHFLGVRFELADFGLVPNQAELTGFCVSNQIDLTVVGGPWPNQVFVYRDNEGLPDIDNPQREATMLTGDGRGAFELDFDQPWRLDEPVFWIMVRGDPVNAGEDFNVETDLSSEPSGNSWLTDRGLDFIFQTEQNLMIRARIAALPLPPAPEPVPVLGRTGLFGLLAAILALALVAFRRLDASREKVKYLRP